MAEGVHSLFSVQFCFVMLGVRLESGSISSRIHNHGRP